MFNYKIMLGLIAIIIGIISYIPYFRDLFKGKTKPHAFTWFVWSLLTGIAFAAQVIEHAGPGAWVTGTTSLFCFIVFLFALVRGHKDFPFVDWLCLLSALFALGLWFFTKKPLTAVILITLTDAIAFIPTFRKSFSNPWSETVVLYALAAIKFAIGLLALETITLTTYLYPASLVIMNSLFTIMLVIRRKQLTKF